MEYRLNTSVELEENLLRQSARQGLPPPEKIIDAPAIYEPNEIYWIAFNHLNSHRMPDGMIPWAAIVSWANYHEFDDEDAELLYEIIHRLDGAFLAHQRQKRDTQLKQLREKPDGQR